ncbi:hypothetical protein ACWL9X_001237 [Escherichia coli]
MQNNQRWEPDWFLQSLLNNHIDKMVERYSCLRAFRTDLFYQDHTAKFFLQDHQQLEWDIRKLMNRMMQLEGKRKANAVCNTCSLQTKLELLLN